MQITDLPSEVIALVLKDLDTLEELGQAIFVCRHFYHTYTLYKDIPGTILASSLDPELLTIAVATELVRDLPKPRTGLAVRDFVDGLVYDPKQTRAVQELKRMGIERLLHLRRTQEAIVDLAFDFAEHAYQQFDFEEYAIAYEEADVGLSPAEATRFCRAFYRAQLYLEAFDESSREVIEEGQAWLVMSFAMFEIEQIACVFDHLQRLVITNCRYIMARDHFFGARLYDYLTLGVNPSIEHFMNQGVVWLAQHLLNFDPELPIATLRDELRDVARKRSPLSTAISASLATALTGLRAHCNSSGLKKQCRETPRDNFDPDSGPPSCLDAAHVDTLELHLENEEEDLLYIPSLDEEDYGIREQAYVLWDMSRVKDHDIFYQLSIAAEGSSIESHPWQSESLRKWFAMCSYSLEDIKEEFPAVFDVMSENWEGELMANNLTLGQVRVRSTKWRSLLKHASSVWEDQG